MSAKKAEGLGQSWPKVQGRSKPQTCFLWLWPRQELSLVTRLGVGQGHKDDSGCGWVWPPQVLPCQHNGTVPSTEPLERGGIMKRLSPRSSGQHFHTYVGHPARGEYCGHPACV